MILLLLTSCSLGTLDYTPCETNAECRDAFGFGYTCGDEGLCQEVAIEPRCNQVYPVDLFQRIENYRDSIVIGTLFDMSSDEPETQAAQLAAMQVDDLAGLGGREFGVVKCTYEQNNVYDDRSMEEATVFDATWLTRTLGIPVIIGPATSSMAEAAYNVTSAAGAVLVSPSATSPALSTIDGLTKTDEDPGLFWRTAPPDSLQGEVVAQDMLDRDVRQVAVIYQTGSYGEGLATVFQEAFVASGGQATLHAFADDTQRDVAVSDVAETSPEEVLFISSEGTDVAAFLNAAGALYDSYATTGIFLTDSARDEDVLATINSGARMLLDNVRGTAPSVPAGTVYDFFAGAYAGAFAPDVAESSVYTAHSWDASWLAIYGIAWSVANEGGITGTGIARGLRHVSAGTEVDINPTRWTEVQATFDEGSPIDVTGASGSLDFDPDTEETTAPIDVWTIGPDHASFETEYTIEP